MRFLLFLVGYRYYYFEKDTLLLLSKIALKNGFVLKLRSDKIKIPLYKCRKFEKIIGDKISYKRSEARGVLGFIYSNLKNVPLLLSLAFVLFLWYFSSLTVWDVRISGNVYYDATLIERELSSLGLKRGALWSKIDKTKLELDLLDTSEYVSWVNVNRVGTVAYVRVIDKITSTAEPKNGYRNLVADSDGVIEQITVKSGVAAVRVGDTVKAGDLLISGILADGSFTYAEGEVIARKSERVEVNVFKKYEAFLYGEAKIRAFGINFFEKTINILKISRNLDTTCDIIRSENDIFLFGRKLPVSFFCEYATPRESVEMEYTSDEMVKCATDLLNSLIREKLQSAELLKIKSGGAFENGVYLMWAELLYSENIATGLPFFTE